MGYYNSRKSFAALAFAAAAFFITSCGDKSVSLESYSVNKVMHVVASDIPDSAQTYFNISLSLVFPKNVASDSVAAKISKSIILEAYDDTTLLKLSPKAATDAFLASQMDGYKDEISFARQRRKEFIKNGENPPAFLLHNSELSLKTSSVYNDNGILSLRMEKSLYDGGAHSLPMIKLLSYSHKTGDRIFLEDIFQEGYESKVRDEIVAAIMRDKGFEAEEQMLMSGYFGLGTLEPTQNFLLKEDTITFLYNPYEIGSYSLGCVEVPVALNAVSNVLRADNQTVTALIKSQAKEKKEQDWK